MIRIGKIAAGCLVMVLFGVGLAHSAKSLSQYNYLKGVSVDRKNDELMIHLQFKKPPTDFHGPEFFKKSVQIDFPLAYVRPSKRYFDTGDAEVRQVYVSQFDPKVLRLRLILAPGTRNLHDYLDVEQKGSALRIRVRKGSTAAPGDPLESLLARASRLQNNEVLEKKIPPEDTGRDPSALTRSVAAAQPSETPAGFSKANTSHRTRPLAQTLGQSLKKSAPKASAKPLILKTQKAGLLDLEDDEESQNPSLVSSSMKMIYTLTLVLGIMFLLFYLFKKFVLKNSVFGGEGKPIKVLSTGFLAPKKSIALVEVAGEVLVLGIANDHISLLANVNDPDRIAQVKNGLRKKKNDDQGPVSDFQEKEEESAESRGRGVDNYKKRLVEPGSTNPFSQYVKNFTVEKPAEPALQKDPGPRRKKVFDKVPVFK